MVSPYLNRKIRTQHEVELDDLRHLILRSQHEAWLRSRQMPGKVSHKLILGDGRYVFFTTYGGRRPSEVMVRTGEGKTVQFVPVKDRNVVHTAWLRAGGYDNG